MELTNQKLVVEVSPEVVKDKVDDGICQAKLGRSAIICAGCPLVRFCALKAELDEPNLENTDTKDGVEAGTTPPIESSIIEIQAADELIIRNEPIVSKNPANPTILEKAPSLVAEPAVDKVATTYSENITPLPYEVKNTTKYLDRLMDDSINIVLADSIAGSPQPTADSFVASDSGQISEAVESVVEKQNLIQQLIGPVTDAAEDITSVVKDKLDVKPQTDSPSFLIQPLEIVKPLMMQPEVQTITADPIEVFDVMPIKANSNIVPEVVVVSKNDEKVPIINEAPNAVIENIVAIKNHNKPIKAQLNKIQPDPVIIAKIDIVAAEEVFVRDDLAVKPIPEAAKLAEIEETIVEPDVLQPEISIEIETSADTEVAFDNEAQDFELWEKEQVDEKSTIDGLSLSELIEAQPDNMVYQAMMDGEDDRDIEFRQANSIAAIGQSIADLLLRELARRAIRVLAV